MHREHVNINNKIKINTTNKLIYQKYLFSNTYNSYKEHDKILIQKKLSKNKSLKQKIEVT